jgi:hypothetical protein
VPALDPVSEAIIDAYRANGGKQMDAWRVGHPDSKASDATASVKASNFFKQDKVRVRIVERQSEVAELTAVSAALTLEAHVKELVYLRDSAKERGMLGPAIKAEELLGQLGQHYVKRVHATGEVDHKHTHTSEPVSDTVEWIRGVLGSGQKGKAKAPLPN